MQQQPVMQGQPNMYNQPNMQANAYGMPPVSQQPKKKGIVVGLIIAIVLLIVAIIGVVGWIVFDSLNNTPEARVRKGFQNMTKEMQEYANPVEKEIDLAAIQKKKETKVYSSLASFNVTIPSLDIGTIGIDAMIHEDRANSLQSTDITASYSNIELFSTQVAMDKEYIYIGLPDLLKDTYKIELEDIGANFNKSVWSEILEMTMDEDFSLVGENEEEIEANTLLNSISKIIKTNMSDLREAVEITENGNAIEVVQNGKMVSCDGYEITLSKRAINRMLDQLQDELRDQQMSSVTGNSMDWEEVVSAFDSRVTSDCTIVIYLDGKDRIVHMATPETLNSHLRYFKGFNNCYILL